MMPSAFWVWMRHPSTWTEHSLLNLVSCQSRWRVHFICSLLQKGLAVKIALVSLPFLCWKWASLQMKKPQLYPFGCRRGVTGKGDGEKSLLSNAAFVVAILLRFEMIVQNWDYGGGPQCLSFSQEFKRIGKCVLNKKQAHELVFSSL